MVAVAVSSGVVAACLLGVLDPDLSADTALRLVQEGYSSRLEWTGKQPAVV